MKGAPEKAAGGTASPPVRLIFVLAVIAWTAFLFYRSSELRGWALLGRGNYGADPCRGRYVYMHDLPPRFNADILADCRNISDSFHWQGMCEFVSNAGLGPPLADSADGLLTGENGWYGTHQFGLDVIFHNRMRQYACLTNHSAGADAVFVPFYAGFDFVRYHWADEYGNDVRDAASADLTAWLMARPEWKRAGGRDHFLLAGRTGWDFCRKNNSNWGTNLLAMPGARNMSVLALETTLQHERLYAVPYPTYFHPRTDADVLRWQDRVRSQQRPWLMAFVGAPRPDNPANIREQIIAQCKASDACSQLSCAFGSSQCHSPGNIMRHFQKATFCLQPPGDSYTRRSVFDSMVAGCIPVFFHPASAYLQYTWHLPKDHARYSVFIPEEDVRSRNVSFEATLRAIPPSTVERMREEVIRLIPTVTYADPIEVEVGEMRDAFDVAVDGIVGTVARARGGEAAYSNTPADEDSSFNRAMERFFFSRITGGRASPTA